MSTSSPVLAKMEYIQKIFLRIQHYMQNNPDVETETLIAFLDSEPPEFRSVAYESASMELGLRDLSEGMLLREWKRFYLRSGSIHSFHLDIGLGWAFAKKEALPAIDWEPLHPLMRWMVFDGMGYFYGLFRGRRTVKSHLVPEGIAGKDRQGYDQGLGRRLWYMAKGDVEQVDRFIQSFPSPRRADLWRGVGIACGYVGGCSRAVLSRLLNASGASKQQFCTGVALAVMSRATSHSLTEDIEMACRLLCDRSLEEIAELGKEIISKTDAVTEYGHWITQFESALVLKHE